ncbi:glycosyltransferase [Roseovarius sp. Pro17]|uniref:glycosyltransferase n=1 Tax=Roseovarius sp. Pro17 TaxID=3108175 RepID=UPI002D795524|nr:glycosyltransferase [Roseovarius sp. Pro17]
MMCAAPKDVAVIIPARNEAERIGACLAAFAGQRSRATVILVVNNTTDATAEIARAAAERDNVDLKVLICVLGPTDGVGAARRIGCDYALRHMLQLRYLMTTDADCIVAPDWIARNVQHLETADVVCGRVELIESEKGILSGMNHALATNEGRYRTLVQRLYARYAAGSAQLGGTHGEAAGASIVFNKAAYLAVGGFEPAGCGEDRQFVRALRSSGYQVLHADDVIVHASCRLAGRAVGGMSDALKARIEGTDYLVDDCLPAADWLVRSAVAGTLGVWPPLVPAERRVHVQDLPANISALETFFRSRRVAKARSTLIARTQRTAWSHPAGRWPGDGLAASAAAPATWDPPGCQQPDLSRTSGRIYIERKLK